jgi:hypothetical protein
VKELADLVLQIISHIIKENNNDIQPPHQNKNEA